jgi:hypothetical protein
VGAGVAIDSGDASAITVGLSPYAHEMTMEVFTAALFDELTEATPAGGSWAGGQGRIVAVAASLAADTGLLRDNLPGRDRDTFVLVLAAVSHAGGRHESTWLTAGDPFGKKVR